MPEIGLSIYGVSSTQLVNIRLQILPMWTDVRLNNRMPIVDPIRLLEEIVSIYSPSTQEARAVDYLVREMRALGFDAYCDEAGSAVGILGDGPRTIVLLGHIDTVHGFIPPRRQGNLLYGRGTVDAKGPLATFVMAAAQAGVIPGWRVVVIGAVEEESATSKGARYAATQFAPEACVIGEPSGWDRVTLGYKGRLLIHYRLSQPIAHTAAQTRGACEVAIAFWQRVAAFAGKFNRDKPAMFDQVDPSLRQINSVDDGFYETVTALLGIRVPPGLEIDRLKAVFQGMADGAEIGFSSEGPAFRAEKNSPLVRAFLKGIRIQGGQPAFKVKTGTSDMNVVGPIWNCPILAYGPGDSALDHTPDEHLNLNEYLGAIAVLSTVLESLPGT